MDDSLFQYALRVDPFVKKSDIAEIKELNEWDVLIVYKDGKKVIYDRYTNYHRNIFYASIHELTDEQEKKEFAERLRIMMKRKYITQEQLAELTGISRITISRYINGTCLPNVLVVRKFAKVLDCSMDELFYQEY